jgi:hypothetical protein
MGGYRDSGPLSHDREGRDQPEVPMFWAIDPDIPGVRREDLCHVRAARSGRLLNGLARASGLCNRCGRVSRRHRHDLAKRAGELRVLVKRIAQPCPPGGNLGAPDLLAADSAVLRKSYPRRIYPALASLSHARKLMLDQFPGVPRHRFN